MGIIWLNEQRYPNNQQTRPSYWSKKDNNYTRVEIRKKYTFDKEIASICVFFAADTNCYIECNDQLVSNSNIKAYGDFIFPNRYNPEQYLGKQKIDFLDGTKELDFTAFVSMGPIRLSDLSSGFGGFYLKGEIVFKDGSTKTINTDKTWMIKLDKGFINYNEYNQTLDTEMFYNAEEKKTALKIIDSDTSNPIEDDINFNNDFVVGANKEKTFVRELPLIYSSFIEVESLTDSNIDAHIEVFEVDNQVGELKLSLFKKDKIRFLDMFSVGKLKITIKNNSSKTARIKIRVYHSYVKSEQYCGIETSNNRLNDLFKKCYFASTNCMQNYLLDSPKHCEPLASCSGDYSIISLTHGIASGDYRVAKHVLRGYSKMMYRNKGLNSNSSYALTFITWLWELYMITGDKQLLIDCLPGVKAVNDEFANYIGENGLVDKPHNYIFMDWLVVDGYNLFCPPSCLGQSVFTMFYYYALVCTSNIYKELDKQRLSSHYNRNAKKLKKAINDKLFNKEKGLYCEGLNIDPPKKWMEDIVVNGVPEGNGKIYYRKHANALAVAFGIANKKNSKRIINKIFNELKECEIQPYFDHYLFKAIINAGLEKKYTMKFIKEWTSRINKKDKGLPEGFFKPTPDYIFDFSHAWACSPFYSFIMSASGLEILSPGMNTIKLNLKMLGLKQLKYSIWTPQGFINIENDRVVSSPKNITIIK